MRIEASVKSKCVKRGAEKKIAEALGLQADLRDMVGRLELNATRNTDLFILKELYYVFMGGEYNGGGKIVITNAKGETTTYTAPTAEELEVIKAAKELTADIKAKGEEILNGIASGSEQVSLAGE